MQQPSQQNNGILAGHPTDKVVLVSITSSLSSPYFLTRKPSKAPLTAPFEVPQAQAGLPLDQELEERHAERKAWIRDGLETLRTTFKGSFPLRMPELIDGLKIAGKEQSVDDKDTTDTESPDLLAFQENLGAAWTSYHDAETQVDLLPISLEAISLVDIYGMIHYNSISDWVTMKLYIDKNYEYMIPPKSSFLLGPFAPTIPVFDAAFGASSGQPGFDFILLDPPWVNRSVKRAKHKDSYLTFDAYELFKLNVSSYLREGGIVGVWMTNSTKWRTFLLEKLFPVWKVEVVAEWLWVKITVNGDPIFDLDHQNRKPYETLILARPIAARSLSSATKPALEDKMIFATPDIHSRKPCLKGLIEPYLSAEDPCCCEIFARNLTEGWFSWGNEVIKSNWRGFWT